MAKQETKTNNKTDAAKQEPQYTAFEAVQLAAVSYYEALELLEKESAFTNSAKMLKGNLVNALSYAPPFKTLSDEMRKRLMKMGNHNMTMMAADKPVGQKVRQRQGPKPYGVAGNIVVPQTVEETISPEEAQNKFQAPTYNAGPDAGKPSTLPVATDPEDEGAVIDQSAAEAPESGQEDSNAILGNLISFAEVKAVKASELADMFDVQQLSQLLNELGGNVGKSTSPNGIAGKIKAMV